MLIPLLLALAAPWPHPDSLSSSRIEVRGAEARLELRCQVVSLLEVIEGLDADGDGQVTAGEVSLRAEDIRAYAGDRYRVFTGTDRELRGGARLLPAPGAVALAPSEPGLPWGWRLGAVDVELRFRAEAPIGDLLLEVTLFHETSPLHIEYATICWEGHDPTTYALDAIAPRARFDPEGRGAFGAFLRMGRRHILGGWDHLAFLVALILSSRRLRSLLAVVTAFTLAHSVTLVLAAMEVVDVSAWGPLVEASIALSIAYVAVDNLVHPRLARPRWIEAFVFGLIHGLGFAGFLAQSLVHERAMATALFSFNLGVELGQVLVVVGVALALRFLPRRGGEEDPFLAPLWLRRAGSAAVAALGFLWFFERLRVG